VFKVHKNDTVVVISGKERGKKGKVLKIFPKGNKVIVEGLNLIKKHVRKRRQQDQAGIIELEAPIDISNIMVYCSNCKKPTRIGIKQDKNKKIRICKKCKKEI
jgi:large subunit ribosomal protein L24